MHKSNVYNGNPAEGVAYTSLTFYFGIERGIETGNSGCIVRYVPVTMYPILAGGNAMKTLEVALDENGKLQYLFWLSSSKLYR